MKVHHAITDGVGCVKIALDTVRPRARPRRPGRPARRARPPTCMGQVERFVDAVDHGSAGALGIAKRSVGTLAGGPRWCPRRPGRRRGAGVTRDGRVVGRLAGARHRAARPR